VAPLPTALSAVALLPPTIWKPLLYMFVVNASSLATGGFVDNFYLDPATREESKVRSGPHNSHSLQEHRLLFQPVGIFRTLFFCGSYLSVSTPPGSIISEK